MILKNKKARNGSKGIALTTTAGAIIAVGVLIFVYLLLNRIPGLGDDIFAFVDSLIGGGFGGIGQSNTLTEAIKCAYYRCNDGCAMAILKTEEVGGFKCSDYCMPAWRDDDDKICDDRAKIHPVEVAYPETTNILSSNLEFADCLMSENDYESAEGGDLTLVIADKDDVAEEVGEKACSGVHLYGWRYDELIFKAAEKYYVWSWKAPGITGNKDTSATTKDPIEFIEEIERDVWESKDIALAAGSSDIYKIVVKSGDEVIDEAFLKVEGRDTSYCPYWKDHPKITFVCNEKEYWDVRICVDETLVCGGFLVKFKSYTGILNPRAVFEINYLPTSFHFICCSDENWYDGSTCPPGLNPAENLLSCEPDVCEEKCLIEKYKYGAPASSSSCYCNTPITKTTSRVFVTSETYTGGLGGLIGADNKCRVLAIAAGFESDIRWRAWLSDSAKDAKDRIPDLGYDYKLVDGTKIADNWADLIDGSLDHAINLDENGDPITSGMRVWTGTYGDGSKFIGYECDDWTSSKYEGPTYDRGRYGLLWSTTTSWTSSSSSPCSYERRIYCFEVA